MPDSSHAAISWKTALWRGARLRCPRCGEGRLLRGYLTPQDSCSACELDLSHMKSEDGPVFFSMSIVSFFVIPAIYLVDAQYEPPILVSLAIALGLTSLSLLLCMPVVKSAFIAASWKSRAFD